MMNRKLHLAVSALLAGTCIAFPAVAQVQSEEAGPVRDFIDENGVDLMTGQLTAQSPAVQIGDGSSGISFVRKMRGGEAQDNLFGRIIIDLQSYTATIVIGGESEKFNWTYSTNSFTPVESRGSMLVFSSSAYTYTYTTRSGSVAVFNGSSKRLITLSDASGKQLTFHYDGSATKPRSVTSNTGYHIKLTYNSGGYLSKVMGFNDLIDNCSTTATECTASGDRPTVAIDWLSGSTTRVYTDALGRETKFRYSSGAIAGIRYPGSTSDDITISYTSGKVSSVTARGVTTTYGYSDVGSIRTTTVTRGGLPQRTYKFDLSKSQMTFAQDEFDRDRTYSYDTSARLTGIDRDAGVDVTYAYDSRGNVTTVTRDPPDAAANIVTSATYPSSCTDPACNKPLTTTDARGKVTDYTYDSTHGALLTVTAPAPATGAVRPQTRYTYSELDSSGAVSATGVYRLTAVSACQTQAGSSGSTPAACLGTADEVKTVIGYGNNVLPVTSAAGAGNDSAPPVTTSSYDAVGNLLTIDGPLSGTADTMRYRYDAARQLVGLITADPDGAGALKPRAIKTAFNGWGQATKVEMGNVPSQLDSDWASFAPAEIVDVTYDSTGREAKQTLSTKTGGVITLQAATQYSYTADGLLECKAERLNPAVFGSLPTSACTLGAAGTSGPDRITKSIYDSVGRVSKVQTGFGTSLVRDEVTNTYNGANQLLTVTDAENNKTTYTYDSFDRLKKTSFPSPTKGAGTSSATDYEELTFDAGSNVTAKRLRDGTTINFTFDNLSRLTTTNLPGTDPDVTYAYDNLGRVTSASQAGHSLAYTYAAQGRLLTETGPLGTVTHVYDLAGRRTSLTYPGTGLAAHYEYLVTGELTKIRENGTSGLALGTYAYDDRGRLTSITRGNGTTTSFGYDARSRLTQLVQDLEGTGTSKDLTLGFTYSPVNQILTNTRSNDAYAWTDHVTISRGYANNGLNQATQAASSGATVNFTYDARGNLTQSAPVGGTATNYTYDSLNRLVSATGIVCTSCSSTASLAYDPMGRLYQTVGSATTRFAYDGVNLIAEYDGTSTLLRRYVHGPGIDAPLAWYEGSGTTNRKYLHADERGSVIAATSDSATSSFTNVYDEYGIPAGANQGRFQYTGQTWLPELGVYYYKARLYSPTLGRFLQADPIGYDDGMNMYSYVSADPVNLWDPTGNGGIVVTGSRIPKSGAELATAYAAVGVNMTNEQAEKLSSDKLDAEKTLVGFWSKTVDPSTGKDVTPWKYTELSSPVVRLAAAPANDNDLNPVCGAAANICMANEGSRYDLTKDANEWNRRSNQCRVAARMCQGQVNRGSDLGIIWYPDGTIVFVTKGKPTIIKVGPKP